MDMMNVYLIAALAPLAGAIVAGLFGRQIGRAGAHWVTIIGVAVSMIASAVVFRDVMQGNLFNGTVYTWATVAGFHLEIGFLIDQLSATMMLVVS